jgi:Delta-aminolevulinic acid dehydratase
MVATPERVVVQSTAPFDPIGGSNAPLKVNNQGNVWVPQRARPRRNRKSEAMRSMVRETIVTPANFIYPLFIHEEVRGCNTLNFAYCTLIL